MDERLPIGGLTVLFAVTLFAVYHTADPRLWVLWAVSMVCLAGAALVMTNRRRT